MGQDATWYGGSLGPGDVVLCGFPALSLKGTQPPPVFGPCFLLPNGWMDEDVTWYGSRPQPRPHCVRRRPSSPSAKGAQQPPLFSAHGYCGLGCPFQLLLSSCLNSCIVEFNPYSQLLVEKKPPEISVLFKMFLCIRRQQCGQMTNWNHVSWFH